ncbi:MAG: IPTL-CTERM sorting domain-containing protein [Dehalococcoidales bacterium]|nr:IPTL-CTERM sorting domain-containing protein [Dehalococcoidales bacterium]
MKKIKKTGPPYIIALLAILVTLAVVAMPIQANETADAGTVPAETAGIQPVISDQANNSLSPIQASSSGIVFTLVDKLLKDVDGNKTISPGDIIQYTATITNQGSSSAKSVKFYDSPDSSTTLVAKSVTKTQGTVIQGNTAGDKKVEVNIGNIAAGASAIITFNVAINNPVYIITISNQATIKGTNISTRLSDDPDTDKAGDATTFKTMISKPPAAPGVSQWGIGIMAILFGGIMIGVVRRKKSHIEIT